MTSSGAVTVIRADTPELIGAARSLVSEYVDHLDALFPGHGMRGHFAGELTGFAETYAPPDGRILLAEVDGEAAGVVVLRGLEPGTCEARRLYVRPGARGRGAARALMEALMDEARAAGYSTMRLVTVQSFDAAIGLYERMGFRRVAAYRETGMEGILSMEREL